MSVLLVPEDEAELTTYLCDEIGAVLLLSDVAPAGEPQVALDPVNSLPKELPVPATFGSTDIYELLFWLPSIGPIKTMCDAPFATDAKDAVADQLTRQSAAESFVDVVDTKRTPVLRLRRSTKMTTSKLAPGQIQTMDVVTSALPVDVRKLHAKVYRWLKKRGAKTDPFQHCPEVAHRRPESLGSRTVWVQPHALKLVHSGAKIWPWNG